MKARWVYVCQGEDISREPKFGAHLASLRLSSILLRQSHAQAHPAHAARARDSGAQDSLASSTALAQAEHFENDTVAITGTRHEHDRWYKQSEPRFWARSLDY